MIYIEPDQWTSDDSLDDYALQMPTGHYIMDSANAPWSFASLDNKILRFEAKPGDHWANDPAGVERDEIGGTTQYAYGTPIDVSYAFMIEPGAANTADWLVAGQLHQNDYSGEAPASPPVAIAMIGERMAVQIGWTDSAGASHTAYVYVSPSDIVRGQYYNMNIAANFDPSGGGQLVVTCDGQTLAEYTGPLGIAGHTGVFWKEGIYESDSPETMAVDFENLNIGAGPAILSPDSTPPVENAESSISNSYAPGDIVGAETVTNSDQSRDVYTFDLTGAYYVASCQQYDAAGALADVIDYNPNGSRSYAWTRNSDGSVTTDDYDASGNLTKNVTTYDSGVVSVSLYANNSRVESFIQSPSGSSAEELYDASGAVTKQIEIDASGAETSSTYGITGQTYVSQTAWRAASGKLIALARTNAAGLTVFAETIDTSETTTVDEYTSSGAPTQTRTTTSAGIVTTNWYASAGSVAATEVKQPDGSDTYDTYDSLGALTQEVDYDPGVSLITYDYDGLSYSSGVPMFARNFTAYESGLTIASYGTNDTFDSFGGDTFTFSSDFGTDVINGFHTAGVNQDLIELSAAVVSSYSSLAIRQSGADTLITIDAHDSIRLAGVGVSAFGPADITFS